MKSYNSFDCKYSLKNDVISNAKTVSIASVKMTSVCWSIYFGYIHTAQNIFILMLYFSTLLTQISISCVLCLQSQSLLLSAMWWLGVLGLVVLFTCT